MSVLETPRIYFRGQISWDPIVTNNMPRFYDEDDCETLLPKEPPGSTAKERVAKFRTDAIDEILEKKSTGWNTQGTHRSTFFGSAISGADLGAGYVEKDAFVDAPANFLGMLVDLEPYGTNNSQLFFDGMSFGIAGGCRIAARRSTRFTARYINFFRSSEGAKAGIASVVWQTCFRTQDLQIDAFDSAALRKLKDALGGKDILGLTVQWNAYRTEYFNVPFKTNAEYYDSPVRAELVAKLKAGGFQPNPARSMMVGVIGLWRKGEPVHEPGDRALLPWPWKKAREVPPRLASAHARLAANSITLDLSNSVKEVDLQALTKEDLGELEVFVIDPETKKEVTLASFGYDKYDKDAYERTSGIVTLKIDPKNAEIAESADLQLRVSKSKVVLLAEAPLRAIPLAPNMYMNEGERRELGKQEIDDQFEGLVVFQVYDRGVPTRRRVAVTAYFMLQDDTVFQISTSQTNPLGQAVFQTDSSPGLVVYVAWAGPDPPPQPTQDTGIDPQVYTYAWVRILPADAAIAKLPPTWDNVYSRVLANWKAMAPCMDNWLDLGDEAQVRAFGPLIKKLTAEAAFEDYRYMPVTRDLTKGHRKLLYDFLDRPAASVPATTMEAGEPRPINYGELNRRTR